MTRLINFLSNEWSIICVRPMVFSNTSTQILYISIYLSISMCIVYIMDICLTFHPCLFSCLSLHLTCIYHCTYVSYHITSTHHSPSHISYFQYLSVCFIFISLADDGFNTAIPKLIVYFVSFTVVIFTILDICLNFCSEKRKFQGPLSQLVITLFS